MPGISHIYIWASKLKGRYWTEVWEVRRGKSSQSSRVKERAVSQGAARQPPLSKAEVSHFLKEKFEICCVKLDSESHCPKNHAKALPNASTSVIIGQIGERHFLSIKNKNAIFGPKIQFYIKFWHFVTFLTDLGHNPIPLMDVFCNWCFAIHHSMSLNSEFDSKMSVHCTKFFCRFCF